MPVKAFLPYPRMLACELPVKLGLQRVSFQLLVATSSAKFRIESIRRFKALVGQ